MKIKVMIVDDEKEFVDALASRLEIRNYNVSTAFSGREALNRLEDGEVDVVLLDVLMPGLTGIETLKKIKETMPLVQVIMLTGNATVEDGIDGMKLGAFDFLIKPADTSKLVEKILSAFELKAAHEEKIRQAEVENIVARRGW